MEIAKEKISSIPFGYCKRLDSNDYSRDVINSRVNNLFEIEKIQLIKIPEFMSNRAELPADEIPPNEYTLEKIGWYDFTATAYDGKKVHGFQLVVAFCEFPKNYIEIDTSVHTILMNEDTVRIFNYKLANKLVIVSYPYMAPFSRLGLDMISEMRMYDAVMH